MYKRAIPEVLSAAGHRPPVARSVVTRDRHSRTDVALSCFAVDIHQSDVVANHGPEPDHWDVDWLTVAGAVWRRQVTTVPGRVRDIPCPHLIRRVEDPDLGAIGVNGRAPTRDNGNQRQKQSANEHESLLGCWAWLSLELIGKSTTSPELRQHHSWHCSVHYTPFYIKSQPQ